MAFYSDEHQRPAGSWHGSDGLPAGLTRYRLQQRLASDDELWQRRVLTLHTLQSIATWASASGPLLAVCQSPAFTVQLFQQQLTSFVVRRAMS